MLQRANVGAEARIIFVKYRERLILELMTVGKAVVGEGAGTTFRVALLVRKKSVYPSQNK
jgi:hypothetical protein